MAESISIENNLLPSSSETSVRIGSIDKVTFRKENNGQ